MVRSNGGNQARLGDDRIDVGLQPQRSHGGPVQCLGMTFENDEARRAYFLERLMEKLADPEFRKIEGFPVGKDEDILALSDPPYYTACPNPFITDFINFHKKPYDPSFAYRKEPFAADVSEGKSDPIYKAHPYHTKVPHKAIMRYILNYTEPGDLIFDGFCGTGMTGVAAQLCGDRKSVEALGYTIKADGSILDERGQIFSKIGSRKAILNDLSPAATFIAYSYNIPVNVDEFEREASRILKEIESECSWMYDTLHADSMEKGKINYTIWSDICICPECTKEIVFWEVAVGEEGCKVRDELICTYCGANLTRHGLKKAWTTRFDKEINQTLKQVKQQPVLISYSFGRKRFEKKLDSLDLNLLKKLDETDCSYWTPNNQLPNGFNTEQPKVSHGLSHVHHFYIKRNLCVMAALFAKIRKPLHLLLGFTGPLIAVSKLYRWTPNYEGGGPLSGTLYAPAILRDISAIDAIKRFYRKLPKVFKSLQKSINGDCCISTNSSTDLTPICGDSVDYIFIDPPFGGNLMYSELNFLWESWLRIFTNNKHEAIQNNVQKKGLAEYELLMTQCFREYYRVLKPGRWMTLEFHNSKNAVWNAIQLSLHQSGFVIADIRILDKKQGTFKQLTTSGAVKKDLIISAYKPNGGLEDRFRLEAGTEESVWDFLRAHLRQLPVFVQKDSSAEVIAERQNFLLFDRMVAFHLRRGATVLLSAAEFYAGLAQRFPEREGMYFLPEQAAEYDKKRMTVKEIIQLQLSITDESSAIQWIKQQLTKKPQTLQDLTPTFMKELAGWSKHEKLLELRELLDQSFIMYDGAGEVPGPIHSYLSTTFKELRNLSKTDPTLVTKAKNRWYIPDHRRAGDLEKLREKALLKEFHLIAESKKRIKEFRIEAVRAGFKKCWDEGDHKTILEVAKNLPTSVVEEDSHLLMYTDLARMRQG